MIPKFQKIDKSAGIVSAIKALTKTRVLVGVPADKAARKEDDSHGAPHEINNAALAYIHDHGAPEVGIPARPFMRPGIANAQDKIEASLKEAGQAALAGQTARMDQAFTKTGLVAQSSIQAKITDGPFDPLAESTIEARARRKGKAGADARKYLKLKNEGVPDDALQDAELIRPLIDTGQLRRAINFVVKKPGQS